MGGVSCPKSSVKIGTAVDEIKLSATPQQLLQWKLFVAVKKKHGARGRKVSQQLLRARRLSMVSAKRALLDAAEERKEQTQPKKRMRRKRRMQWRRVSR